MYKVTAGVLLLAAVVAFAWPRQEIKVPTKPVVETVAPVVSEPPKERPHVHNLGEFTLTAYCACSECCGKAVWDPAYGVTASGTTVQQGRTVAVDPEVIPLGSVLYINGDRYIAEDTGGAVQGNHVDIYFDSHEKALEFGVQEADVWIWREA